jgi:hypothetical protein
MEVKSKILFAIIMSFFLSLLPKSIDAQLYHQAPGVALKPVSAEDPVLTKDKNDLGAAILKKYKKQLKKQQIVVPDSVYVVFQVDEEGLVTIKERGGYVRTYINILEDNITKAKFAEAGEHRLALVFKPLEIESFSIWEVDEVPELTSCKRAIEEGNETYFRSCFNYAAEERIRDLAEPSSKKEKDLTGIYKARLTISPNGLVSMIEFDPLSTNASVNDYFMYQLYYELFPKGIMHKGKPVSYVLDIEGSYFQEADNTKSQEDTTIAYDIAFLLFDHKTGKTSKLHEDTLMIKYQSIDSYLVKGRSKLDYFPSLHDEDTIVQGGIIFMWVSHPGVLIKSPMVVYTPKYLNEPDLRVYPASHKNCSSQPDAYYASTCTSQFLMEHIQNSYTRSIWLDILSSRACHQVLLFDKNGNLSRQRIVDGDFNAQFDLECLAAIANIPQFQPAKYRNMPAYSQIKVITIFW